MLKLRKLSSCSLIAITAVCTTSAVAQTAPPALPPAASGTYATNTSRVDTSLVNNFTNIDAERAPIGSLSISYDSASGVYRLSNDASTAFGSTQAIAPTATTSEYNYGGSSFNRKTVSLFRNSAGNYSYTRYGLTDSLVHLGPGFTNTSTEAFVFGTPTTAPPRTGAAYYTGLVDGWASGSRLVNSTGELLANFASGEIASGLNLSTATGFVGRYDGRGLVAAGTTTFAGSLFGSGNINFVGQFNGGFYGPAAQEVGLTFTLASLNATIAGAFIGIATTPPVAPTSPPATPIPTPIVNTSLVAPIQSETFVAIGGEVQSNNRYPTGNSGSAVARTEAPGAIQIAYNATLNTYTLSDTYGSTVFEPVAGSTSSGTTSTRTINAGTTGVQSLTLFVTGSANPRLALTYLSYGLWSQGNREFNSRALDRSFVYGVETPSANMPRSGAALYDGVVAGNWALGGGVYRLADHSDGSVLANFYTGEIRTRMSLVGTAIGSSTVATLGRVDGYGSIAGGTSSFTGTMTGTNNDYSGNFQGAFYGPAYQEAGVSFALSGANGTGAVNGVIIAKQVPIN